MGESARLRKTWEIAAAHAALEFFERPGREKFDDLMKAAGKAGCEESVRGIALDFLETGASPFSSMPQKGVGDFRVRKDWPLPVPAYLVPLFCLAAESKRANGPHYDVLIDMAITGKRNDDVLRWYDAMRAGKKQPSPFSTWTGEHSYADRVAAAVAKSHPERALAIYRQRVEDNLQRAHVSAYEAVAAYLRKMRPILQSLDLEAEWAQLLADIRLRYRNRPRFMEILDKLDAGPILQQRKSRR